MNQQEYREGYLRSDHWAATRESALERAGRRCQVCNADKRLDVHHRTYERLGNEEPGDLTVLCRGCHDTFHATRSVSRGKTTTHKKKKRAAVTAASKPSVPTEHPAARRVRAAIETLDDPTGPFTTAEIALAARMSKAAAGAYLGRLRSDGLLTRGAKYWRRADAPAIAETQRKEARWHDALPLTAQQALKRSRVWEQVVQCPACHAAPGESCGIRGVHMERVLAARSLLANAERKAQAA